MLVFTSVSAFHEVSVYPKKELPFFILFTAGLCSFTAMLAMLTHQFPDLMGVFVKAVSPCSSTDVNTHTSCSTTINIMAQTTALL